MKWMHTLVAGLLVTTCGTFETQADASPKLNVVFILADDLGWGEVGCYGQKHIPTPNIDELAANGMRFTQHYSGAPVCAPSRCVLMTGKHLGHAEIRGNKQAKLTFPQFETGQHPISESAWTLAMTLQRAGYATGAMGKWGLGPVGSTGESNRKGFDLFFGYNCQAVAHSYYPPYLWRNDKQVQINSSPIPGHGKPKPGKGIHLDDTIGDVYAPKRMIAEAEKFIADHKNEAFFLYLPFIEPHMAMHPPRESVEKFPKEWDKEPYRAQCGYLPHPRPRAGYAAMISDLDSYVGRVMEALKNAGVADHTLVIFTSDNGTTHARRKETHFHVGGVDAKFFNSTAGLRGYKGSVYEGGIRVPMIVRCPGLVPEGTTNETPGYFADWFPTICEATGLNTPDGLDGESLWPVMTKNAVKKNRKPMVWVFSEYGGQVAVRIGDFKAVRQNLNTKSPGPWEVYNLETDSGESHDLAAERPDVIRQAETILQREVAPNAVFPVTIPGVNDKQRRSL